MPIVPRPPSDHTIDLNRAVAARHDLAGGVDEKRAERGRVGDPPRGTIDRDGGTVWNFDSYEFLGDDAPASVNPSLWRQARLNRNAGLYEVCDGIWQVRGYDLANATFIAGSEGWVVVDPLTSGETARAALDLVNRELGERPVTAVIYTHSHIDHFGGAHGIIDAADVVSGRIPVVAPVGFLEAAISENVIAGNAMTRRATYMYGPLLPPGPQGHVDAGLGKGLPFGTPGLIPPSRVIEATGEELVLDGVRIVFHYTPDTEAPAEMNFLFPDHRALCMAENCAATMHNLYTPRGAKVRDALSWSKYLHEAIGLFADQSDVMFTSHHWPVWGRDEIVTALSNQRDLYRFIHDQTMRLANAGFTADEIAEQLELPPGLDADFSCHGYYGTLNHNAKAVYQRYLGWFDGIPAHLHPHPPVERGRRYVEAFGGARALRAAAASFSEAGDYRFAAELLAHAVFADAADDEAAAELADALEQLGYQAESAVWRDFYLTGAQELRNGSLSGLGGAYRPSPEVIAALTPAMIFDLWGVRIDGTAMADRSFTFAVEFTDAGEEWTVGLSHGALHAGPRRGATRTDGVLRGGAAAVARLISGMADLETLEGAGDLVVEGDRDLLRDVVDGLVDSERFFSIVVP